MKPLVGPFRRYLPHSPAVALTVALGLTWVFWPARPLRSDNFVFYFPGARHVVPIDMIKNAGYLPLLQVLNLIGTVNGFQQKQKSLKVWFGNAQIELRLGDKKVRVDKVGFKLSQPIRVAEGQWLVPMDFLSSVLPKLTHEPIEYQMGAKRIFIGDVKPASFSVRLDPISNGARLTVQFTDSVTVRTAASNGKWVVFLGDRPVEPLEQTFRFQDPYVSELQFDDHDGVPKLILTPAEGGLNFYPAQSGGGKTLVADVLKPPAVTAQQPPAKPTTAIAPTPARPLAAGTEGVPAPQAGPPLPVVVLDAGHGGQDPGARSRDGVLEKDLVAQLGGRIRLALLSTKKYRIVLTRVGDANPTFEERELAANAARPIAFLTFHAGNFGVSTPLVAVYTYQLSSILHSSVCEAPRQFFVPWRNAQEFHLNRSRQLAQGLQQEFEQISGVNVPKPAEAPVRALRSVNAPAVAIEVGSLSPDSDSGALTNSNFQQQISTAIVRALDAFREGQT